MEYERISSKENRLIKLYKKVLLSKKYRNENRIFALEGRRLISDALKNGIALDNIFISERAYEKNINEISELARKPGVRIYIISDSLEKILSDTPSPQGIFALCHMPQALSVSEILARGSSFIILDRIQDPGNMGTIIRTADALGISGIITCNCCEIYSPKVIRSAMGSVFRTSVSDDSSYEDIIEKCNENNVTSYAAVLSPKSESLRNICFAPNAKNAVWIGNEGSGLLPEICEKCSRNIIIPMKGGAESLNAAAAAAIFMWQMSGE